MRAHRMKTRSQPNEPTEEVVETTTYREQSPSQTEQSSESSSKPPESEDPDEYNTEYEGQSDSESDGDVIDIQEEVQGLHLIGRGESTIPEERDEELGEDIENIGDGVEELELNRDDVTGEIERELEETALEVEEEENPDDGSHELPWTYNTPPGRVIFAVSKPLFYFDLFLTDEEIEWARDMMMRRRDDWEEMPFGWHLKTAQQRLATHITTCVRNKFDQRFSEENKIGYAKQLSSLAQIESFAEHFHLVDMLGCDATAGNDRLPLTAGEVLALLFAKDRHIVGLTHQILWGLEILVAVVVFETIPAVQISPTIVDSALRRARMKAPRGNGTGFGTFGLDPAQDIALTSTGEDSFNTVTSTTAVVSGLTPV
ncbi:hypothetical protein TWF281_004853 [Arthrobotrys megalospora]